MHTLNGTTSSLPIAKDIENNGSLSNRLLESVHGVEGKENEILPG